MISFAGIDLNPPPDPDGRLAAFLREWWHLHGIREFQYPGYNVSGIDHLPVPPAPQPECPRPGILVWPSSASRWGHFHALVTGDQLRQFDVTAVTTYGGDLILDDGTTQITARLYALPPRVVCRHAGADYHLLTLVDIRFYFWQAAYTWSVTGSWATYLTDMIEGVITSVPTVAAVPAAYGTPDPARWEVGWKPTPLLIDAACATVGLRFRLLPAAPDPPGTSLAPASVGLVSAAAALASEESDWTRFEPECIAGGRTDAAWIAAAADELVDVVFPGDPPVYTTVHLSALALPEFGGATGATGATATVGADLPATASGTDRTNYATQAAKDYYLWAMGRVDATFRGFIDWTPTGLEDRIEWDHSGVPLTRVFRAAWSDRNVYGGAGDPLRTFTGTVVTGVACVDGSIVVTTKTLSVTGRGLTGSLT